MNDRTDHSRRRTLRRLIVATFFLPNIGILWLGRVLLTRRNWRKKLIGMSICGNLLFVAALVVGYLEERAEQDSGYIREGTILATDCVACQQGRLAFCKAPPESDLGSALPNSWYVASDGLHRASFAFSEDDPTTLKEVSVFDRLGRTWITANLQNGTLHYERFTADSQTIPPTGWLDKDGDGIPEIMVNWELGQSFERENRLTWRRIDRD